MLGNTNSGIGSQVHFIPPGICDRNWTSMYPQGGVPTIWTCKDRGVRFWTILCGCHKCMVPKHKYSQIALQILLLHIGRCCSQLSILWIFKKKINCWQKFNFPLANMLYLKAFYFIKSIIKQVVNKQSICKGIIQMSYPYCPTQCIVGCRSTLVAKITRKMVQNKKNIIVAYYFEVFCLENPQNIKDDLYNKIICKVANLRFPNYSVLSKKSNLCYSPHHMKTTNWMNTHFFKNIFWSPE